MFEPWIGKRFRDPENILGGTRLLILGESHYTKDAEKVGKPESGCTPYVVQHYGIDTRHQFFAKLAGISLGMPAKGLSKEYADFFWNSVVFYNFVPVYCDGRPASDGGKARRPEDWMFEAGAAPFREIIRCFEPEAVIVCGLELWEWVSPNLDGLDGNDRDVVFYDDGNTVYCRIQHPSYVGFKQPVWERRIHYLLELAAQPRARRKIMWSEFSSGKLDEPASD